MMTTKKQKSRKENLGRQQKSLLFFWNKQQPCSTDDGATRDTRNTRRRDDAESRVVTSETTEELQSEHDTSQPLLESPRRTVSPIHHEAASDSSRDEKQLQTSDAHHEECDKDNLDTSISETEKNQESQHVDILTSDSQSTTNETCTDGQNESDADSESDTKPIQHCTDKHVLSDYEKMRLQNIARNNARLVALGLIDSTPAENNAMPTKRKRMKRKKTSHPQKARPSRRSTRIRRAGQEETHLATNGGAPAECEPTFEEQQQEEVEEELFEVSPVVQYVMDEKENLGSNANELVHGKGSSCSGLLENAKGDISSLSPVGRRLAPPQGLTAIYSMQFYSTNNRRDETISVADNTWIVGAGKAGIVALWDCKWSCTRSTQCNDNVIDPIFSWKAHGGRWVSDAHFLPTAVHPGTGAPSKLVTAANDGTVCLWDLETVSVQTGAPKLLYRTHKELHKSGIFSMDLQSNDMICTGSKDKTVAVSNVETLSRGKGPLWRSDHHTAKVSAVKFRGSGDGTLASASDDGHVAIHDYKSCSGPVAVLEDAHDRPHSVVWDPFLQHVFLTAGLDHEMKTWDMRFLKKPLCTFYGHVPPTTRRCKKINHPSFYTPQQKSCFVLCGGEGSQALSMFKSEPINNRNETVKSCVYSRGTMPSDCGDVGCIAVHGEKVAVSVDGGEILLLAPRYQ